MKFQKVYCGIKRGWKKNNYWCSSRISGTSQTFSSPEKTCTAWQAEVERIVSFFKKCDKRYYTVGWIWNGKGAWRETTLWRRLGIAHLRGDDAVVGITLRDVGLSSRRGFFMADVHRPAVHPVLLPCTLTIKQENVGIKIAAQRQRND